MVTPIHTVFLALAIVFFVIFVVTFSALIYHWVHRDTQNEILREMYRGLPNVQPRVVEVYGKVGMRFAYPDPDALHVIHEVPQGKRALVVACVFNNEHANTPEDIVCAVQDVSGTVFPLSVQTAVGTFGIPMFEMYAPLILDEGERLVYWAENPDIYVKLDVTEFDATNKSPKPLKATDLSDTTPFVWTPTKPVMLVGLPIYVSGYFQTGAMTVEVSLNDILRDDAVVGVATPNTPTMQTLTFGNLGSLAVSRRSPIIHAGDTLKFSTPTAGAGPFGIVTSYVELDGPAANPTV